MQTDSPFADAFIQARHFTPGRKEEIGLVPIHSTEGTGSARSVALWFASGASPQASCCYVVDAREIIQCTREADTAWAAPGANANGISIELCGFAHWTAEQWCASGVLEKAAPLVADICQRRGIPIEHRTGADLLAGLKGIPGHKDVNDAYHRSNHFDPGPLFPWAHFLALVEAASDGPPTAPLAAAA